MLPIYGKLQWLRCRSAVVRVRFLKGLEVVAVWVQFEDESQHLSEPRLFLCTDTNLHPIEILRRYAKRWATEPLFNQMKHQWGVQQTWQQSRQVVHRWIQIISLVYALPLLLAVKFAEQMSAFMQLTPWRFHHPVTAGRVRIGLQRVFRHVALRYWWQPKSRKFQPPDWLEFESFDRAA